MRWKARTEISRWLARMKGRRGLRFLAGCAKMKERRGLKSLARCARIRERRGLRFLMEGSKDAQGRMLGRRGGARSIRGFLGTAPERREKQGQRPIRVACVKYLWERKFFSAACID